MGGNEPKTIFQKHRGIGRKNAFNEIKALALGNLKTKISELVQAALGRIQLTLLIRNARVVNVYTGEIIPNSLIGVYKDTIVFVGPADEEITGRFTSDEVIDARGMIAIPGLIDTHLHVESSMVTPTRFAEAVLPRGTTTVCADPHEIGNVLGKEGVRIMVENAKDLPMKMLFFAPTCVPESNAVTAGAEVTPADIEEMLDWEGVCGLGEVMDYEAVLSSNPKMIEILEIGRKRNVPIDGHGVLLSGRKLNAYVSTGVDADHENFISEQVIEKIRTGMYLKLRGPDILNVKSFVSEISNLPRPWNFILVTDDVMPDRLIDAGHLDASCRAFIDAGMDPVEVVRSVTLRPALSMRMLNLGAVAPGKIADIVLLENLEDFKVRIVISNGKKVAEDGRMVVQIQPKPIPSKGRGTVRLRKLAEKDFDIASELPSRNGIFNVNVIDFAPYASQEDSDATKPGFLEMVLTNFGTAVLKVEDGRLSSPDIALVRIFERHGKGGRASTGFARNLIRNGAFATTVAHDAHNLMVIGTDPRDMVLAANSVIDSSGGSVATREGKILAQIELPIAGLMSEEPVQDIANKMREMRKAFKVIGIIDHPYMPIPSLLPLSVIPHARITDKGIYDVDNQKFVSLTSASPSSNLRGQA